MKVGNNKAASKRILIMVAKSDLLDFKNLVNLRSSRSRFFDIGILEMPGSY
jgi:hypothetical protein